MRISSFNCFSGDLNGVKGLIANGANTKAKNKYGQTALLASAVNGNWEY